MMTNDILQEKYRVQKQLATAAKNVHDYFARTHESAEKIMDGIGANLRYVSTVKPPKNPGQKAR